MSVLEDLVARAPVVPVIVIERLEDAAPLARALVEGGLSVLEITLRTPVALEAIGEIAREVPEALVGAGTLTRPVDVGRCRTVGAAFGVSPGAPRALIEEVKAQDFPFLAGCATATEAMTLSDDGFDLLKFFPAGAAGGPALLRSLASPLPGLRFCPTGGVSLKNAAEYLSLPNVAVVGGSWVCPAELVEKGDWKAITRLATEAAALPRP